MFNLSPPHVDSEDRQVQLITTLDNTEVDLLTLEYIKVCVTNLLHIHSPQLNYSLIKNLFFKFFLGRQKGP